ncbi:MAG: hypothetical protein Q9214_001973 [Letrouitia sp. 1 TL-2023]
MEGSSSNPAEPSAQKILLHVLSPSTEVPNKLTFPDILISTTVKELKFKIQDAVPSKPDPARQRLIYRGKPLTQDQLSLKDVFTQEVIKNSESLSLHLVLPPSANPQPAAAGTNPANNSPPQRDPRHNWMPPFIAQPHGSQAPTSSTPSPHGTPAPTTTGNNPSSIPQTGPIPMPQGAPYNHFPPHLQNALNSSFASFNQHLGTHFAHHAQQMHQMPFPPQAIPNNNQWQQPPFSQPSFQQIIAQQQQARAAAGHQGLNPTNATQSSPAAGTTTNQNSTQPRSDSPQNPTAQPGNTNTVVRENRGPNGESFRMVIQATSISRPSSGIGQRQGSQPLNQAPHQGQSATSLGASGSTHVNTSGNQTAGNQSSPAPNQPPQISNPLAMFLQRLSSIETSLSEGNAPAEAVFDHAQTYLNNLASQPNAIPQGLEAPLRNRLNNLSTQADQLRASLTNMLMRIIAEQQANQAMTQGTAPQNGQTSSPISNQQQAQGNPTPGASTAGFQPPPPVPMASFSSFEQQSSQLPLQLPSTPEVYLLSSPAGPYALLLSPFGLYGGALPSTTLPSFSNLSHPNMNQPFAPQGQPSNPSPPTYANPNPPPQGQQPPPAPVPGNLTLAQAQQAHQQQQQQQNNQARDFVRIILPLGGHLWLLIRLFGFVYFFTAGGGQRRAILLGICAFLVFIAQTGVFRPMFQAVWDPIRRHAEGLIPLQPLQNQQHHQRHQQHQQGRIEGGGGGGNQHADVDANAPAGEQERANERRRQNTEPTPEQMADRLLRERREGSIWRRAERAAALFIASLVPGIGERHIAARDAAEARRLAEEREREVQVQREREGREERELEAAETRRRESMAVSGGVGAEGLGAGAGTGTGAGGGGADVTSGRQQGDEAGNSQPLIET